MATNFVALSDMHMGYEHSIWNNLQNHDKIIDAIAELCGGATDRLILNGDCFEACIPVNAGQYDPTGFPPWVAAVAQEFFRKFTDKITCTSLVLVWGNHDYSMWQRLATSCGVPVFTNDLPGNILLQHDGHVLPGAESFLGDIIGAANSKFLRIRSAYPNYILGRYWPYIAFHHGHLLDKLVLGWEPEVDYMVLKALIGQGSPKVSRDGNETIATVHQKTKDFIGAMWRFNSKVRAELWEFMSRAQKLHVCPYYPIDVEKLVGAETQNSDLGDQVKWYLDTLMMDSTTPGTIGPTDKPGYLFIGHDHDGGKADIAGLDGRNWRLINTGGWTLDKDEKSPHAHVAVWSEDADEPTVHCIRT